MTAQQDTTSQQSKLDIPVPAPPPPPPPITHILETCLQAKDLKAATAFYEDVFNVAPFLNTPRMSGFSFAHTTLLLFQLGATAADSPMPDNRGTIPGHGPTQNVVDLLTSKAVVSGGGDDDDGNGRPSPSQASLHQHFCFAVQSPDDVGAWEKWLEEKNVKILGKVDWPRGGRSVYFADVDGNIGEVASRGIWEHY
ncbi:hypothetical protein A1O3_05375 [Capronia epimyces CBS 606.96]|uniref:VOC domain-containing protein n=1 Tax=Capronia epimyces CBS 606.96 TaxID=1182542 RepID=W9Y4X7_9EURO|nr:uncharacterized protein A1O3_05375 [Capronia epimyces CBS 606.96]EXJ84705.1 hypothetical protein A1O3_05375 [Capronia epimyces CBS 606.96]